MIKAPLPAKEHERLRALRQTGVLDTGPEESFDRLTDLAAKICGAPIALITLVDVDRQWFKSCVGLEVAETPRDVAFCAHAILQSDILVVPDALEDERFADNPLVISDPKIRFYAGEPLVTHDGNALGTFCVIDIVPRELGASQIEAVKTLGHHATTLLELRRVRELLAANAKSWEEAGGVGDHGARAQALDRLGDNLRQLVLAREDVEASFRALERNLQETAPSSVLNFVGATRDVDSLLCAVIDSSDRLVYGLGAEDALRVEAIRIGASARKARDLLGPGRKASS